MNELVGDDFWNDRRRKIADILDSYATDRVVTMPAYLIKHVDRIEQLFDGAVEQPKEQN